MVSEQKRRNRVLASESVAPLVLALDIGTFPAFARRFMMLRH